MSYDRFWDAWYVEGVAYAVCASKEGAAGMYYDYKLDTPQNLSEQQSAMRIGQLESVVRKKKPPHLPKDALLDDIVVLFGPQVSPKDAILSLEHAIKLIKTNGILVGRDHQDNDVEEKLNGKLVRL